MTLRAMEQGWMLSSERCPLQSPSAAVAPLWHHLSLPCFEEIAFLLHKNHPTSSRQKYPQVKGSKRLQVTPRNPDVLRWDRWKAPWGLTCELCSRREHQEQSLVFQGMALPPKAPAAFGRAATLPAGTQLPPLAAVTAGFWVDTALGAAAGASWWALRPPDG